MQDTRYEPTRNSLSSMASSAMMRDASTESTGENAPMISDSENGLAPKRPRKFLDRMLGRTPSAGHRASVSVSVPAYSLPTPPWERSAERMSSDSPRTSPMTRGRPSLTILSPTPAQNGSGSTLPSAVSPTSSTSSPFSVPLLTINTLSNSERAEKVRRNRKLVQILGNEISGTEALVAPDDPNSPPVHLKPAFMGSTNNISPRSATESFSAKQMRRHSSPVNANFGHEPILSPRVLRPSFLQVESDASSSLSGESGDEWSVDGEPSASHSPRSAPPPTTASVKSGESFIDMSAPSSSPAPGTEKTRADKTLSHAPSIASIATAVSTYDNDLDDGAQSPLSPEDAERARKRATLAKLHRFLGSRIPPELVLPMGVPVAEAGTSSPTMLRPSTLRKRTSLAIVASSPLSRHSSTSAATSPKSPKVPSKSKQQERHARKATADSLLRPPSEHFPVAYMSDGDVDGKVSTLTGAQRVHIMRKQKKIAKMLGHCPPGTMSQQSDFLIKGEFDGNEAQYGFLEPGHSKQYMQHRYSINSLTFLVQHNDQEQLQELLTYIKTDDDDAGSLRQRVGSSASSLRHRGVPSPLSKPQNPSKGNVNDDVIVIAPSTSVDTTAIPPPSPTDSLSFLPAPSASSETIKPNGFQQRRKRAAKLSSFFGVDYKELFSEVLDVIESEVREDSVKGTLSPEETQELLMKLRKLKKV